MYAKFYEFNNDEIIRFIKTYYEVDDVSSITFTRLRFDDLFENKDNYDYLGEIDINPGDIVKISSNNNYTDYVIFEDEYFIFGYDYRFHQRYSFSSEEYGKIKMFDIDIPEQYNIKNMYSQINFTNTWLKDNSVENNHFIQL